MSKDNDDEPLVPRYYVGHIPCNYDVNVIDVEPKHNFKGQDIERAKREALYLVARFSIVKDLENKSVQKIPVRHQQKLDMFLENQKKRLFSLYSITSAHQILQIVLDHIPCKDILTIIAGYATKQELMMTDNDWCNVMYQKKFPNGDHYNHLFTIENMRAIEENVRNTRTKIEEQKNMSWIRVKLSIEVTDQWCMDIELKYKNQFKILTEAGLPMTRDFIKFKTSCCVFSSKTRDSIDHNRSCGCEFFEDYFDQNIKDEIKRLCGFNFVFNFNCNLFV